VISIGCRGVSAARLVPPSESRSCATTSLDPRSVTFFFSRLQSSHVAACEFLRARNYANGRVPRYRAAGAILLATYSSDPRFNECREITPGLGRTRLSRSGLCERSAIDLLLVRSFLRPETTIYDDKYEEGSVHRERGSLGADELSERFFN
jgi:hypothetical protein